MESEATIFDGYIRPNPCHQISLADNFALVLNESEENIECASAQLKRNAGLLDPPF
jgi:hypothetical protein